MNRLRLAYRVMAVYRTVMMLIILLAAAYGIVVVMGEAHRAWVADLAIGLFVVVFAASGIRIARRISNHNAWRRASARNPAVDILILRVSSSSLRTLNLEGQSLGWAENRYWARHPDVGMSADESELTFWELGQDAKRVGEVPWAKVESIRSAEPAETIQDLRFAIADVRIEFESGRVVLAVLGSGAGLGLLRASEQAVEATVANYNSLLLEAHKRAPGASKRA